MVNTILKVQKYALTLLYVPMLTAAPSYSFMAPFNKSLLISKRFQSLRREFFRFNHIGIYRCLLFNQFPVGMWFSNLDSNRTSDKQLTVRASIGRTEKYRKSELSQSGRPSFLGNWKLGVLTI